MTKHKGAQERHRLWVKMYVEDKMSIRQIADDQDVAYSTVHHAIKSADVRFRPRGGAWRMGQSSK